MYRFAWVVAAVALVVLIELATLYLSYRQTASAIGGK